MSKIDIIHNIIDFFIIIIIMYYSKLKMLHFVRWKHQTTHHVIIG